MLSEAQLVQALVTGSKASQFFRPFCPQGSDPPTTYSLLSKEQTPGDGQHDGEHVEETGAAEEGNVRGVAWSRTLTCVTPVGPELWHLSPLVGHRVVRLATAQLVRVAVGAAHHVQTTLGAQGT